MPMSSPLVPDFQELAATHLESAYNLARWLVRDPALADDVVQDAMLRALRYYHGFRGENARAWLLQIVRNVAMTRLKLSLIHISEPTRLLSISYAVFCLKK